MPPISTFLARMPLITACAVTLLIASGLLLVERPSSHLFVAAGVTLLGGYLLWWVIGLIVKKVWWGKKSLGDLIISLCIVFLVWQTPSSWLEYAFLVLATLITVLAKHFLYYRNVSIVNPAVIGLLAATATVSVYESLTETTTSAFISWHGMTSSPVLLTLMLIWTVWGTWRMKKHALIGTYFLTFLLGRILIDGIPSTLAYVTSLSNLTTLLLLSAVMLVEPRTAPPMPWQQLIYGALAALCVLTVNAFHLPGGEVLALALMNLLYAGYRIYHLPKRQKP